MSPHSASKAASKHRNAFTRDQTNFVLGSTLSHRIKRNSTGPVQISTPLFSVRKSKHPTPFCSSLRSSVTLTQSLFLSHPRVEDSEKPYMSAPHSLHSKLHPFKSAVEIRGLSLTSRVFRGRQSHVPFMRGHLETYRASI